MTRPIGQIRQEDPKAIWSMHEVPSDDEDDDAFETRSRPKYERLQPLYLWNVNMVLISNALGSRSCTSRA